MVILDPSTGPDGPGLQFEIDAGNRLTRVVDAADDTKFVDYKFDGTGKLNSCGAVGAAPRVYAYDGSSEQITTIWDNRAPSWRQSDTTTGDGRSANRTPRACATERQSLSCTRISRRDETHDGDVSPKPRRALLAPGADRDA